MRAFAVPAFWPYFRLLGVRGRRMAGIRRYVLVLAAATFAAWPASAHHGGDVEWGQTAVGPITGTATKFAFQFPHVFFEMTVEENGAASAWTITTRWTPTILRDH